MRPSVGMSSPPRMFNKVLLPEPEGPSSTTSSPAENSTSTLLSATTSTSPVWYTLRRPCASKMGGDPFAAARLGAGADGEGAGTAGEQDASGCGGIQFSVRVRVILSY